MLRLPIHKTNPGFFRFRRLPTHTKGKLLATLEHGFGNQFGALLLRETRLAGRAVTTQLHFPKVSPSFLGSLNSPPATQYRSGQTTGPQKAQTAPLRVREVKFRGAEVTAKSTLKSTRILH